MTEKPITTILHFTDSHLFSDPEQTFLRVRPYAHFQDAVATAKQLGFVPADFLALTGDISQDFSAASYELAFSAIANLAPQLAITLGNHDKLKNFEYAASKLGMSLKKSFAFNTWQVLLLNSHWQGHTEGQLAEDELKFLQQELKDNRNKNIIIFLHHHVLPIGSIWLDKIGLHNAEQFLNIISAYNNIKVVISGHVHQEFVGREYGIDFLTTPSLAWQFAENTTNFKLSDKMPGFRVVRLFEDGNYTTEVVRLAFNPKFVPNLTCTGY